ncbi:MAG: T9SS type A sorting domain-containing protein, partial [Flavisolibacter sp.]
SGPAQFAFSNANSASTTVSNLAAGTYVFRLTVLDNGGKTSTDDVSVVVNPSSGGGGTVLSERVLIDLGTTSTASPDGSGKYWNIMNDARPGVRVSNAKNTENIATGINLEVVDRINGNWDAASTGLSAGNSTGIVSEYPATSTVDHAIAHNSTTGGLWKFTNLDPTKTYNIKFWGTRSTSGPRILQIKKTTETTWMEYDAANNKDYNRAAVFTSITGVTEVSFNIKVKSGSTFGHINVIDIESEGPAVTGTSTQSMGISEVTSTGVGLYPNPFADRVVLQVNNAQKGDMKITVSDVSGILKKAFTFNKSQTSTQVYLSLGDLAAGTYIVQIRIGEWTDSKTIIKQ